MSASLIVVDVQNDFLPGGSLAVPEGDKIVPVINSILEQFTPENIIFTQDWHPADHGSFASNHEGGQPFTLGELDGRPQMLWPDHCVQGTEGANLSADLDVPEDASIVTKGLSPKYDSYSGFRDDGGDATEMEELLTDRGSYMVYVCGLATDYCVKATALDAVSQGHNVKVIIDACRGVTPGTTEEAIKEMEAAGVEFVKSDALSQRVNPLK